MSYSVTINPNSVYSFSAEDYVLFQSLAKKAATRIEKETQEFVNEFADKFFREATEKGALIGRDGQPVKPSPVVLNM